MATRLLYFKFFGYDIKYIDRSAKKILYLADAFPGKLWRSKTPIPLPTKIEKWTVNRSPFKHKKARDTFERRTHYRLVLVQGDVETTTNYLRLLKNVTYRIGATSVIITDSVFEPISAYYSSPVALLPSPGEVKESTKSL